MFNNIFGYKNHLFHKKYGDLPNSTFNLKRGSHKMGNIANHRRWRQANESCAEELNNSKHRNFISAFRLRLSLIR